MTQVQDIRRITAFNSARDSENKMHDDTVAKRYGFAGGLVTGVDIFAYMTHFPVAKWGRDFLRRGLMEARFLKPVYDGDEVALLAEEINGVLTLRAESRGEVCATGQASLPAAPERVNAAAYPATAPAATREPVNPHSYAAGKWLGTHPVTWVRESADGYLRDVRADAPIYRSEGLCHPGMYQRLMNQVLIDNAILGPWIHVGSRMQMLGLATVGSELTARARVIDNYERKGHQFVELDALVMADDVPVAKCWHIAIWQPRVQDAA